MRILFVSSSPIRKDISIGNTFLNVFSDMDGVELASICTKSGAPDASVSRWYCITEHMLINNLCRKGPAGAEQTSPDVVADSPLQDNNIHQFVRIKRWTIFFLIQNLLWFVGRWKSSALRAFIGEYKPDLIVTVLSEKIFLNRLIVYIQRIAKVPMIVYAWDNNYTLRRVCFSPFDWIGHAFNRHYMRKTVAKADKLYVISDVQKQDYEVAFQKPCKVLTKAEDFDEPPLLKAAYATPRQFVYTGNLYANRWRSLAMVARVLERINADQPKAQLRIYTATPLTKAMKKALEIDGTSFLMGSVPSDEILRIQRDADVLVHVEPIDLKNRLAVRQSFSTKVVDYLKAARPIVAVGPQNVASIRHLLDHDAAIVADHEQELYEKLTAVLDHEQELLALAKRAYACGKACHNKTERLSMLREDLEALL